VCAPSAPHHPALDPRRRRERFGRRRPLGHRLTRGRKPDGTGACRESGDGRKTSRVVPRKTRVIGRELHCTKPSLQGCKPSSPATTSNGGAAVIGRRKCGRLNFPHGGRAGMTGLKGTNGSPTSRSLRLAPRECGMAYSSREPGSRSAHSSRGSHVPPGRGGKRRTGRRGTGVCG
jgi:hypothetical protein